MYVCMHVCIYVYDIAFYTKCDEAKYLLVDRL